MLVIPVTQSPYYEQVTTLEGTNYRFTFKWNKREGYWYFDLADADAVPIRSGIKCVLGTLLLKRVTDARRPPGEIACVDVTASGQDAGFDDFGSRVLLYYFTAAEVKAITAMTSPPA